MSTAAHTPGPWFTARNGFSTVYIEARIGGGMLQEVASCGPTQAGNEQQAANARLLAAAPELLAALEKFAQLDKSCNSELWLIQSEYCEDARAAIAKATGCK